MRINVQLLVQMLTMILNQAYLKMISRIWPQPGMEDLLDGTHHQATDMIIPD